MQLRSSFATVGSVPVLALSGSVDLSTVPALTDALARIVRDHPGVRVAVDLDGIDVLDDTGLGALLGAAGRARQGGGDLVIVTADVALRSRFAVTGLDRAVTIAERLADLASTSGLRQT